MQYIISDDPGKENIIGDPGTQITGFKDVKDIFFLSSLKEEELPLHINYDFSPALKEMYKDRLKNKKDIQVLKPTYDKSFYIHHCGPCDIWNGWAIVFLEDLIKDRSLFDFVFNSMLIMSEHTNWELDVRHHLYLTEIPTGGEEGERCLAIKQDNNGETYYVCRNKLSIEDTDWGGLEYTPDGPVSSEPGW